MIVGERAQWYDKLKTSMSSSFRLFEDPFTAWLQKRDTHVEVYQPGGYLGRPPIGRKITVGKSTVVYRIVEERPEELIVVLLERQGERSGLRSSLADFARFIALVKKAEVPVRTIRGHVDVLGDLPKDHLSTERIAAFYKRYLAADQLYVKNGIEWVVGDLTTHVPPLSSGKTLLDDSDETAVVKG